jgi:tripeptide aminopeptidase
VINRERLVNRFLELVQIDSEAGEEQAIAQRLIQEFRHLGIEARADANGNVIATCRGRRRDAPVILLSAHMDTVRPGRGVKPIVRDEVVFSDGTTVLGADNKAAIAALLELVTLLRDENIPCGDLELVFTVGEEVGSTGARQLDYSLLRASLGYVMDSPDSLGTVITAGPAHNYVQLCCHGRSAHTGVNIEQGISALRMAAEVIIDAPHGAVDEVTRANFGLIKGGHGTNVVPDEVVIKGEVRSLDKSQLQACNERIRRVVEKVASRYGSSIDLEFERIYDSFSIKRDTHVVQAALRAAKAAGLEPRVASTLVGSDINIFNKQGIVAVNLGLHLQEMHSPRERYAIADLVKTTELLVALVQQF